MNPSSALQRRIKWCLKALGSGVCALPKHPRAFLGSVFSSLPCPHPFLKFLTFHHRTKVLLVWEHKALETLKTMGTHWPREFTGSAPTQWAWDSMAETDKLNGEREVEMFLVLRWVLFCVIGLFYSAQGKKQIIPDINLESRVTDFSCWIYQSIFCWSSCLSLSKQESCVACVAWLAVGEDVNTEDYTSFCN